MINPVEIGQWVKENGEGFWKFVGVSEEGEIFLENLKDLGDDAQLEFSHKLLAVFPILTKTIYVVKPSLSQMTQMVEDLNKLLRQEEPNNLLGVGTFNG